MMQFGIPDYLPRRVLNLGVRLALNSEKRWRMHFKLGCLRIDQPEFAMILICLAGYLMHDWRYLCCGKCNAAYIVRSNFRF